MTRKYSLFSLMAVTALSLTLAACDDNSAKTAGTAADTSIAAQETAPAAVVATTINVSDTKAYATAEGAANGAVFLTLHNPNAEADRLTGASSAVAATVELHESAIDENGVMRMNRLDGIDIPAGGNVTLAPGGYHIMLIGLNAPLQAGVPFDVTLDFEKAEDVTLSVNVVAPVAVAPSEEDHSGHDHSHEGHDHSAEEATDAAPTDGATTDEAPVDVTVEETAAPETTAPAPDAGATEAPAETHDHEDGHDHSH